MTDRGGSAGTNRNSQTAGGIENDSDYKPPSLDNEVLSSSAAVTSASAMSVTSPPPLRFPPIFSVGGSGSGSPSQPLGSNRTRREHAATISGSVARANRLLLKARLFHQSGPRTEEDLLPFVRPRVVALLPMLLFLIIEDLSPLLLLLQPTINILNQPEEQGDSATHTLDLALVYQIREYRDRPYYRLSFRYPFSFSV